MMHTLLGYWAYTVTVSNLLISTLAALSLLGAALMLGARRSARWAHLGTMPVVLVLWWWIACQGGRFVYDTNHKGESFGITLVASLLVLFPGLALILGAAIVADRLQHRRNRKR